MKKLLPILVVLCCPLFALCQDITGHWKGTLFNDSTNQSLDYEVVIKKEKGKYTAYSCTNYLIDGKKYYGIKKINIRVAKDGKIVMQDIALQEHNYPLSPNKNVLQLNVLDLAELDKLEGLFVTNSSKDYKGLTGKLTIKRVSPVWEEDLLSHFNRAGSERDVTIK